MKDTSCERGADIRFRIWQEFSEMPGLRLTLGQLCRLLGDEPHDVVAALQDLIDSAVVRQIGPYYVRADHRQFTK
jgi:hypothetical protein